MPDLIMPPGPRAKVFLDEEGDSFDSLVLYVPQRPQNLLNELVYSQPDGLSDLETSQLFPFFLASP